MSVRVTVGSKEFCFALKTPDCCEDLSTELGRAYEARKAWDEYKETHNVTPRDSSRVNKVLLHNLNNAKPEKDRVPHKPIQEFEYSLRINYA